MNSNDKLLPPNTAYGSLHNFTNSPSTASPNHENGLLLSENSYNSMPSEVLNNSDTFKKRITVITIVLTLTILAFFMISSTNEKIPKSSSIITKSSFNTRPKNQTISKILPKNSLSFNYSVNYQDFNSTSNDTAHSKKSKKATDPSLPTTSPVVFDPTDQTDDKVSIDGGASYPTKSPSYTYKPTYSPAFSYAPTRSPVFPPTSKPTKSPRFTPTRSPTSEPTYKPSDAPVTKGPTYSPQSDPTDYPTKAPRPDPTYSPTKAPRPNPTHSPTKSPSYKWPYAVGPTHSPTTGIDWTSSPTNSPRYSPTAWPTKSPRYSPTHAPNDDDTGPTFEPSATNEPTIEQSPTPKPSHYPTKAPRPNPTEEPTKSPVTRPPTKSPSDRVEIIDNDSI